MTKLQVAKKKVEGKIKQVRCFHPDTRIEHFPYKGRTRTIIFCNLCGKKVRRYDLDGVVGEGRKRLEDPNKKGVVPKKTGKKKEAPK